MSTYSQAWHDTPPPIRHFYVNHFRRYLHYQRPPFAALGYSFNARQAYHLAQKNWTFQTADVGSFNPAVVYILDFSAWDDLNYSLPLDPIALSTTWDQFVAVPEFATNYPRDKYKVPRCNWTGKPRHRQNLT